MQVERSRRSEEVEPSGETDEQRRDSGKRVSNAWVTYLGEGDSSEKSEVIPHGLLRLKWLRSKGGLSRLFYTPLRGKNCIVGREVKKREFSLYFPE